MRWIVLVLISVWVAAGCGGVKIPIHSGYKNDKAKPWKKPKAISLDDKSEGKVEGELSYVDYQRARWYSIDVPAHGELALRLEITPPGDATNEDFDLAVEVLDPGYRVIAKSDLEDEDARELNKTKTLFDLAPGKYLVHLYLQSRMDSAEFTLRVAFKPTKPAELKSDFPAQVAFVPELPMVPLNDDAPAKYRPTTTTTRVTTTRRTPTTTTTTTTPTPAAKTVTARIVGVSVVSGGVQILIGRGTASDASDGMKASLKGISGSFPISGCTENTCRATIAASPDQVKAAGGSVVLSP